MAEHPFPASRRDRQRQTREALILAAREAFSRDGYSGANLELIARDAGFSKGAVYSNFESKAALFLAVMEFNIDTVFAEGGWDVFERVPQALGEPGPNGPGPTELEQAELEAATRGFALATLEFIGVAGRDEQLLAELSALIQRLVDGYTAVATASRADEESLSPAEVGALLTALDQGIGLISLAGGAVIDQRLMRIGLHRLLDPAHAAQEEDGADPSASAPLHDQVVLQRIYESIRRQNSAEHQEPREDQSR